MSALVKPTRGRDEAYLSWLRAQPCCVTGRTPCDASHIQKPGHGKMGSKTDDRRAVPMIRDVHVEFHKIGHAAFELKYGIDLEWLIKMYNQYYKQPPVRAKRERRTRVVSLSLSCECGRGHGHVPPSRIVDGQYNCPVLKRWVTVSGAKI